MSLRTLAYGVLGVQLLTFGFLGLYYLKTGELRLGVAQLLLLVVQAVIYSGGI